jgi:hypothetical protein
MLEDDGFDVGGVDVVPAPDDEVFLAPDEVEEAVLVEVAEIAAA